MVMRVRFAPSPTGHLHVGNARTALFNWLLARGQGGIFLLRIEDTDLERSTRESEAKILEDLRWMGLDWDEGVEVGGSLGPYRQSERFDLYRTHTASLLRSGHAYRCFCSVEKLEAERQAQLAAGQPPRYAGTCRGLDPEESASRQAAGDLAVVRLRVPASRDVVFEDLVRGPVAFHTDQIGDPVLVRSDGVPAYNYAVVIDDHLMAITHVIRGEDHIRTRRGRCWCTRHSAGRRPRSRISRWSWDPITRRCRNATAPRRSRSSVPRGICLTRW